MDSDIVYQISISENQLRELVEYLYRAAQPRVEYSKDELEMAKRAVRVSAVNAQAALDMVLMFNGGIWEREMRGWMNSTNL